MQKFYPEEYFKRSGYPMNNKGVEYYDEVGISFRRKDGKQMNADEYKRFNEDVQSTPNY